MRPAQASSSPPATAADGVFDAILADIVRGVYPPRSRLPAERELARTLGASRPTLREALGRLAEWNLVEARRGSGVVVRDMREWSIEVLPAYLRFGPVSRKPAELLRMVGDMLALRRNLIVEIARLVAGRVSAELLGPAREAAARAWEARAQGARFVEEDLGLLRAVVEAANFWPAVWMLNRIASVYFDIATTIATLPPPADYPESMAKFLDALAAGDGDGALSTVKSYLDSHDRRLLSVLEALA
jgi:DNA-binding FadR family transcriptional regulator